MLSFELNDSLESRIEDINKQYLLLVRDVAMSDPAADFTLGCSKPLIEVVSALKMPEVIRMSKCGVLLPRMRVDDPSFWQKVLAHEHDTHDLFHSLLEREGK